MKQNINNGMMTFDEYLFKLFKDKLIDRDTAIKESDNPNNLRLKLSQYSDSNLSKSLSGVPQTSLREDQLSAHNLTKNKDDSNF